MGDLRGESAKMWLAAFVALLPALAIGQRWTQVQLDNLAQTLDVKWLVKDNVEEVEKFYVAVTLTNNGQYTLGRAGDWSIYLTCIMVMESDNFKGPGISSDVEGQGIKVTQIQGSLFKIEPTDTFLDLQPGQSRKIKLQIKYWQVSKTDSMPNWYFEVPGLTPKVIQSTVGEELSFVEPMTLPNQVKRFSYDTYTPFTAQDRYRRNHAEEMGSDGEVRIIPKPLSMTVDNSSSVLVNAQTWRISAVAGLENEANYLTQMTSIPSVTGNPATNIIRMRMDNVPISGGGLQNSLDTYSLTVDPATNVIEIIGQGSSGVFYGVQTLVSLMSQMDNTIYKMTIIDSPRFEYRGMHMDVGRNFHSADTVKRMLGNMALYKLNRLHFHLAEDEGWRLQIPGLNDLVSVGSRRCHDLSETTCILPQIGSGPDTSTSGTGYYTTSDYQDILREAAKLHIQVVPEIDMPGHSRAAIKSMEVRYRRFRDAGQEAEGLRYRLIEEGDTSRYTTAQLFTDSNLNPCLESTYIFIEHVMRELVRLHEGIQPLKVYHYGADEIANGAYVNSTRCKTVLNTNEMTTAKGKEYFFERMSNLTSSLNLNMAVWEDGLIRSGNEAFERSKARNSEVYAYPWNNIWEWGTAQRPYSMANQGYKVVMVHASHLFFDHPYEPDPEERGYYWATRFTDTMKTFGYTPENMYALIKVRRSGQAITREEVCGADNQNCPALERPENIAGMEGTLWSETLRTRDHLDSQMFPRVLALAERAWHKAPWEAEIESEAGMAAMKADWESFARLVGHKELARLDARGVKYRLPPPGAIVENGFVKMAATFPGLRVEYSRDGGNTWWTVTRNLVIHPWETLHLRTRSPDMLRSSRLVTLNAVEPLKVVDQPTLDYVATNLDIKYKVVDNFQGGVSTYLNQITMENKGDMDIMAGNWGIYYCSIFNLPDSQPQLESAHMTITHVKGCIFKMAPTSWFKPLKSKEKRVVQWLVRNWSVAKTDVMPNWYIWAEGMHAKTIDSTRGPEIGFVEDFVEQRQYQRYNTSAYQDRYSPYTSAERYDMDKDVSDLGMSPRPVIPTPVTIVTDSTEMMNVSLIRFIYIDPMFQTEADYLRDQLIKGGVSPITVTTGQPPQTEYIRLFQRQPHVRINNDLSKSPEAYALTVDPRDRIINIWSSTEHGVFNGIQSLLSLVLKSGSYHMIPRTTIYDAPRFQYRGMHLDSGRNFRTKETVLKLLDAMAMYKLNVLHFHITEDEGWRVQIPGLEELTQIGGQRCHDMKETKCLFTQLGSGPDTSNSGSGYYTVDDYKEILRYAKVRHIEVIPEVDSPGHGRAAIIAMRARRQKLLDKGDIANADLYRLEDLEDQSKYLTVQLFDDNAINPCIPSTYRFFTYVIDAFVNLHKDINPLKTFHFGGDEVAGDAWKKSPACEALLNANVSLKEYFTQNIANISRDMGLDLGGWEDGLMESVSAPFERSLLRTNEVLAYAWDNVWEWGVSTRAYTLANAGYKVVLAHVTHLYFDHPYEPDPEERGYYWGPRFASAWKTFAYLPDSVYDNVDVRRSGQVMTKEELCGKDGSKCTPLEKPENIIGMQGQLWSETSRTPEHVWYMVFPRIISLAERAWHKASWEDMLDDMDKMHQARREDWRNFTNALGYQEYPSLDLLNITYRVPPPGARIEKGRLKVVSPIPGLGVRTSVDGGKTWQTGKMDMSFRSGTTVWIALTSADGSRMGRAVSVKIPGGGGVPPKPSHAGFNTCSISLVFLLLMSLVV